MKNILKYIFNWNMLLIFLVNILFADTVFITANIMAFISIIYMIDREMDSSLFWMVFSICSIIMLARLLVLPVFYFLLGKFAKDEPTQNFLHKLRYSIKIKLLILFIAPIPFIIENCMLYPEVIKKIRHIDTYFYFYLLSFIGGLLGSYVVLFLYWYILDRRKKSKNPELIEDQKNE